MKKCYRFLMVMIIACFCVGCFTITSKAATKKNVLIVYYSQTGTTRAAAKNVQKLTGGDFVQIKTEKSYPSNYDEMLEVAEKEQDENARPALKTKINNMKKYDVVMVGYPIWYGLQPMLINTFLESYDFAGKTVVPFCTSGGSGVSASVNSIKKVCKTGKIGKGLDVTDASTSRMKKWLQGNKQE